MYEVLVEEALNIMHPLEAREVIHIYDLQLFSSAAFDDVVSKQREFKLLRNLLAELPDDLILDIIGVYSFVFGIL